ncbi:hypothetical protein [Wenzhouxiangella sp. EGI_FJ10409]|uniref:hypothetical protein n=1 Tax=Wenzhouxiangella sp. EGI_FJ10409 TaxID=3243767 RepID=UPI0035DFD177
MLTALPALLLATAVLAQNSTQVFPEETVSPDTCKTLSWNGKMARHHARMINACQEVVSVNGERWARFTAEFVRLGARGKAIFNVRDHRGRFVKQIRVAPQAGQVAIIDGRPIAFGRLSKSHRVSLYVPESEIGAALTPCTSEAVVVTQVVE